MSEQAKTELSCGAYGSGGPWYPLRKWWPSSRLFNQDVGLPPFLEPGDPWWMNVDWLQRSLAASAWPAYAAAPLFVPYISGSMHHPGQKISQEQCTWRVGLDLAHFSPTEISLSVKDGFLEVGGRHEERRDEHGFIARCFTRKYRLPAEIDATKITSTLSVDGILTVEAPVPETSVPAAIIIPIKVEVEVAATGEEEEKHEEEETPETEPDSSREPEAPEVQSAEDPVEEGSAAEVHVDQADPGSATAEPQQDDEREQEDTHEKPAGESNPSVSADGNGTESLQDSSKQDEAMGHQEIPDTDASKQPEHKEPAVGGEIQVMSGSAEEITQPEELEPGKSPLSEVPSQELEAPDTKQEQTE
nr:PREDICTED: heat shock protein beta-1-like [Paralichthys olivaceus]